MDFYVMGIGSIDYDNGFRRRSNSRTRGSAGEFSTLISELGLVESLKKHHAVGEVLSQPFDKNGKSLIDRRELKNLKNAVLNVPLDILAQHVRRKSASIIAVAGGEVKGPAIHAAIRAKIFNVLVTDSNTIRHVMEQEHIPFEDSTLG